MALALVKVEIVAADAKYYFHMRRNFTTGKHIVEEYVFSSDILGFEPKVISFKEVVGFIKFAKAVNFRIFPTTKEIEV